MYAYIVKNWIMGDEMESWRLVLQKSYIDTWEESYGRWHRSKERVQKPYSNFPSYMMNKKWWLEEQFNLHMMRFQQVKCLILYTY